MLEFTLILLGLFMVIVGTSLYVYSASQKDHFPPLLIVTAIGLFTLIAATYVLGHRDGQIDALSGQRIEWQLIEKPDKSVQWERIQNNR